MEHRAMSRSEVEACNNIISFAAYVQRQIHKCHPNYAVTATLSFEIPLSLTVILSKWDGGINNIIDSEYAVVYFDSSDASKKLNEAYAILTDWLDRYSEEDAEDAQ